MASLEQLKKGIVENKATIAKSAGGALCVGSLGLYLYLRSKTDQIWEDTIDTIELLGVRRNLWKIEGSKNWTVVDLFYNGLKKNPDGECMHFIDTNTSYTWRQVDELSNKIGNWALSDGIKQGDVVGLIMDNRPEFVITWLGLAKVGAVIALINTNLSGHPLVHSLKVCEAKCFIVGHEHAQKGVFGKRAVGQRWYCYGGSAAGLVYIDPLLDNAARISRKARAKRGPKSELLYIYTSGTTGNPKAGVIKNIRFYMAGMTFGTVFNITDKDRIYCTLPLYHSAGGMIGVGLSWWAGATLVFRKKFSAKNFWSDVHEQRCTVMQYIGELCRYLLSAPESEHDKSNIRLAIGNGLRPDIWTQFQERFNIAQIGEFYASTEGNTTLFNPKNKATAVGYIPPMILDRYPVKLIKMEEDDETPVRTKRGWCVEAAVGEKGELIGLIDNADPSRYFDGYTDPAATAKKVLKDAFSKGDQWFRSGDLLRRDDRGFFYFVDRIGDTFRWKGENVATSEVEFVVASVKGVELANVYGVSVPHHDGRAGMALLTVTSDFSLEDLYATITKELPNYARPLFLRMAPVMDTTSTMKFTKVKFRNEGFDPQKVQDKMYFRNDSLKKFEAVTQELYDKIAAGTIEARL
mmetsp:Transcript_16804/g.65640  ORF Transcript_16804/g.65640 Transcript_16804/m.65640 type:complete len:634 (-) Transcript_16804:4306-6207(-)